ncbi:MAG: hypothetical protein NTZ19_08550, partial [Bacteroidetes bacterium]|nr:hypothetical protein [Bacteroidota bacterium]
KIYLVYPFLYAALVFFILLFAKKHTIWLLPSLFGISYILSVYPSNSTFGLDLIIIINSGFSGIFNIVQFLAQRNGMNNIWFAYLFHILGMFLYQFIILNVCLSIINFANNKRILNV